jgi:hypothetical protein
MQASRTSGDCMACRTSVPFFVMAQLLSLVPRGNAEGRYRFKSRGVGSCRVVAAGADAATASAGGRVQDRRLEADRSAAVGGRVGNTIERLARRRVHPPVHQAKHLYGISQIWGVLRTVKMSSTVRPDASLPCRNALAAVVLSQMDNRTHGKKPPAPPVKHEPIGLMTLGNMRSSGPLSLDVTCTACKHREIVNVDDVTVLSLGPRVRCPRCGHLGASVRADWSQLRGLHGTPRR